MNLLDKAYLCDHCGKRASKVYVFSVPLRLRVGTHPLAICSICIKEAHDSLEKMGDSHGMTMVIDKDAPR